MASAESCRDHIQVAGRFVVEFLVPRGTEMGERNFRFGGRGLHRSPAAADDAGQLARLLAPDPSEHRAAREARGVDSIFVERIAAHVGTHRAHGLEVGIPGAVASGVVGAHQNPAVALGGGAKDFRRRHTATARIEYEKNRPAPLGRVVAWEIQGVGLARVVEAGDALDQFPEADLERALVAVDRFPGRFLSSGCHWHGQ